MPNFSALVLEQGSKIMSFPHTTIFKKLMMTLSAISASFALTGIASAQQVLVMNEDRILSESEVGQYIMSQIEIIGQEIDAELAPRRQQIQSEGTAFRNETSSLTEEAIAQRQDLVQRFQQLQANASQFEQLRQLRTQELVATQQQAMQPVLEILSDVLQEIVTERGAVVLLDRSQVVYAGQSIDISQEAINRLNQRITTTPVTRVRASSEGAATPQ